MYVCVYIYVYVYISHHRRGQNCQHVEGGQKFEAIRGMQSQNAGLKMHPRNFAHITARMPARAQEWGGEEWRGQGKARAFLPFPLLVKRHPDIFLLISRFNENFFISPPLPSPPRVYRSNRIKKNKVERVAYFLRESIRWNFF